ncbi:Conserved_hypothetical protein [Hexamita inflata]|uniref:Integrase catalytic domain-containing protein n=1 Tax=Hexamita inflata TaxID=28002 RepID=A0AA86QZD0_9EUKA|nr:Conserved hypothetical protein [Hexamita inflata]
MPLTKKEKQYVFINQYDNWMCDVLYLNDSKHIEIKVEGPKYIYVLYNPANHRLYIELMQDRSSNSALICFKNFQEYITKLPDQQIHAILSDDGSEFKNVYQQYLLSQNIEQRLINPNMHDNLILAPINVYCKYIRAWIQQQLLKIQPPENTDNDFVISDEQLYQIVSSINDQHNFHKPISAYHNEVPANITVEDVKQLNAVKKLHNSIVDTRDTFNIGDVVKVELLKDNKLDKARTQKWSYGDYVIINKVARFYEVSPMNFDMQSFEKATNQNISTPVYFRKPYQLKPVALKDISKEYYPLELENTMQFQITRIISAHKQNETVITDVNDFINTENPKYLVETIDEARIFVNLNAFRDTNKFNIAELDFWFGIQDRVPGLKYSINCSYL